MQLHFSCEVARLARQRPAEEDASIRSFGAHEFRVAHRGGSQPGGENATPPGLFGRRMSGRLLGLLGFHRDSRIQPPGTCLPAATKPRRAFRRALYEGPLFDKGGRQTPTSKRLESVPRDPTHVIIALEGAGLFDKTYSPRN